MDQLEDTLQASYERWEELLKAWAPKYISIGTMLEKVRYRLYFPYLTYAPAARRMVSTTTWIERLHRDYRRVLRMQGALPNAFSLLVLLARARMRRKQYDYKVTQ